MTDATQAGASHTGAATGSMSAPERVWIVAILALTFAAYAGAVRYEFVFDDYPLIVENPYLRSWTNLPRFFAVHLVSHTDPNAPGNYYRPVLESWMLLNYSLWGPKPAGWHLASLVVHLLNTLLVYWLARRCTANPLAAAVAGLVFGLHPVHIEAVVWVMGITEPLLALLSLACLLCYVKWHENPVPRKSWWMASLAFFALATLTKETALVLPGMIFGYEWFFAANKNAAASAEARWVRFKAALLRVAPFLGLAAIYLVVRIAVLGGLTHPPTPLPFSTLVLTWPFMLWFCLGLLVWPFRLSAFYDTPYVTSPDAAHFLLPLVGVLAVAAFLLWVSRRSQAAAWAAVWIALPLIPPMNFTVLPRGEIAHDHFLYLPSVGFAILIALALTRLRFGSAKILGQPAAPVAAAALLAAVLGLSTFAQKQPWRDDLSLYSHAASVAPQNIHAANNLARALLDRGRPEEALRLYQDILARDPGRWLTEYNLGLAYYKLGQFADTERHLMRAIEMQPLEPEPHYRLALVWLRAGRPDAAIAAMRHAISLRPAVPGYHLGLGVVLESQGQLAEALAEFRAELDVNPNQQIARDRAAALEAHLRR